MPPYFDRVEFAHPGHCVKCIQLIFNQRGSSQIKAVIINGRKLTCNWSRIAYGNWKVYHARPEELIRQCPYPTVSRRFNIVCYVNWQPGQKYTCEVIFSDARFRKTFTAPAPTPPPTPPTPTPPTPPAPPATAKPSFWRSEFVHPAHCRKCIKIYFTLAGRNTVNTVRVNGVTYTYNPKAIGGNQWKVYLDNPLELVRTTPAQVSRNFIVVVYLNWVEGGRYDVEVTGADWSWRGILSPGKPPEAAPPPEVPTPPPEVPTPPPAPPEAPPPEIPGWVYAVAGASVAAAGAGILWILREQKVI